MTMGIKMIKLLILLVLFPQVIFAALTVDNVPRTKTGGTTPALQDSVITAKTSNIGISSTAPGAKLDVQGTIRASSTITASNFSGTSSGTNTGDQTTVSGNAGTATALAANGANCSAGNYPLGVDASGAVESCTSVSGGSSQWLTTAGVGIGTYDKVGIGTVTPQGTLDIAKSNVIYVGCAESIDTAISTATSGDTLILGSCTYSISAAIDVDKSIKLIGQGNEATIIDVGSFTGFSPITITADNVLIKSLKVTATDGNTAGTGGGMIFATGEAGTTLENVWIEDVHVTVTNDTNAVSGIRYQDAGGGIEDSYVYTKSDPGSAQTYGIANFFNVSGVTADSDIDFVVKNTEVFLEIVSTGAGEIRPLMMWHNATNKNEFSQYGYFSNITLKVAPFSTANTGVETFTLQSNNAAYSAGVNGKIEVWLTSSTLDCCYKQDGNVGVSTGWKNVRIDDYAILHEYQVTTNVQGSQQNQNSGVIYRDGILEAYGIRNTAVEQAPQHLNAIDLISLTGQQGGDKPGTGAQTGLVGAGISLTGGQGGAASAATTTGTGGKGGSFNLTAGHGGNQQIATSTTNVGANGGDIVLTAGDGGDADSATVANTAGNGGNVYLVSGNVGIGTITNGSVGDILLGINSSGTTRGYVGVRTLSPVSELDVSSDCGSSAECGGELTLKRNDTVLSANDRVGSIQFYGNDTQLTTQNIFGQIEVVARSTVSTDAAEGTMFFRTASSTVGNSPLEYVRINHENFTVNENSANSFVSRFEGDSDAQMLVANHTTSINNVGIGTQNPMAKLGILQTAAGDAFRVHDVAGDPSPFLIDLNGNVGIGTSFTNVGLTVMNGNVGIGTWNATSGLEVVGSIKASTDIVVGSQSVCQEDGTNCPASAPAAPAGGTGAVQYNNAGTTAGNEAVFSFNGTNIGIGTTNGRQLFEVNGTQWVQGNIGIGSLSPASLPIAKLHIVQSANALALRVDDVDADDITPFTVSQTGNVGIATSAPSSALQVASGNLSVDTGYVNIGTTNSSGTVFMRGYAGGVSPMFLGGTSDQTTIANTVGPIISNVDTTANNFSGVKMSQNFTGNITAIVGARHQSSNTADLVFATSNGASLTEKMRITNTGNVGISTTFGNHALSVMNGNVGIGTWNPRASLDITGNIRQAENYSYVLDDALSADGTYSGITEVVTAGETVAFGDIVYLKAADSQWYLTDADADATAGAVRVAIAVTTGADNGSMTILTYGKIRADANFPDLTVGAPAYISITAGDVQVAQPSGTDDVIRIMGYGNTANELFFNPSNDYLTHT